MYTMCKVMLVVSIVVIALSIIELICNSWQKKHDKKNAMYNNDFTKTLLIGIGTFSASGLILLLRMYWVKRNTCLLIEDKYFLLKSRVDKNKIKWYNSI